MLHSLGIDGTITADTLENRFRTLILHIQDIEKDLNTKNIYEADIVIQNTEDSETELMSGNVQIYIMKNAFNSEDYPNPYSNSVIYTKGTGSSIATNYNAALAETIFALYFAEGSLINNPNKLDRKINPPDITLLKEQVNTPCPHNCIMTVEYEIPIITTVTGNSSTVVAREWLNNSNF